MSLNRESVSDYYATPLGSSNAWESFSDDLAKIEERLDVGLARFVSGNEKISEDVASALRGFCHVALMGALSRRASYHSLGDDEIQRLNSPHGDHVIQRAQNGLAAPVEMYDILRANPPTPHEVNKGLQSVELARLTHPFEREAPALVNMHDDIAAIAGDEIAYPLTTDTRVGRLSVDPVTLSAIFVEKREIGTAFNGGDPIRIMGRQCLVACSMLADAKTQGLLKLATTDDVRQNKEKHRAQSASILEHLHQNVDQPWVQPLATSFYAYFVDSHQEATRQ